MNISDFKSFNESFNQAQEIFITKINTSNINDYREPRLSPYIEDGKLTPAKFIICEELDMEGRSRIGTLGIFPIKPEHILVEEEKTFDKKKTWYSYRLNETGWKYLESSGLKHPGRGWVSFDLVDDTYINNIIIKNEKSISQMDKYNTKLKSLLNK